MNSVLLTGQSLMQMVSAKAQDFCREIDNVHMVWLEEIQQEANRMFSRDFNAEPELMPKTPSQKKNSRRKRVSLGRQEENQARRRFSKGKRSNLRGSSVKSLNFIAEENAPEASTSLEKSSAQPKRATRKNKQSTKYDVVDAASPPPRVSCDSGEEEQQQQERRMPKRSGTEKEQETYVSYEAIVAKVEPEEATRSPPNIPTPELVVRISSGDRLSAELARKPEKPEPSPGRSANKIAIAGPRRSSARCSLKLRHSLAGLRTSMIQDSLRRASRRSMAKRKTSRAGNSTCSSSNSSSHTDEDGIIETAEEEEDKAIVPEAVNEGLEDEHDDDDDDAAAAAPESNKTPEIEFKQPVAVTQAGRVTRSVAANSPKRAPPSLCVGEQTMSTPKKKTAVVETQQLVKSARKSRLSNKRKAPDTVEDSPSKRFSPPKKSQSTIRPNMKSFLHTVQKNQMLMMTPNSLGRSSVIKSFIKHTTPLRMDSKTKERVKLEALKKKQELEEERMKKIEEEKKKKQDELKRKRDERLRRVYEAKVKEDQREEEKKKKIEQKMAQIDDKNDKRLADEKAKKKVAAKRQEELELKKKAEEEAKRKKLQQAEEEKRQQELQAKRKAEEEEQKARRLAETRRALELEREKLAAMERERVEKEKAQALQREVERAAREKERRELEEKRRELEAKRKREELQQRIAADQKAAKERILAEQKATREREAAAAAAKRAAEVQHSVMKTPVGKGALNRTMVIEGSILKTPVGKGAGLNVTIDVEQSPQSYAITPKGGNKPLISSKSAEDYGMDQNSDDSTDDESAPRKPIPSWAEGHNLQQVIMKQYFTPPDMDSFFGRVEPPKLENIFYKSKPRYFKRTSSAVWHSPPGSKI